MIRFSAPVEDTHFVLHHVLRIHELDGLPGFSDLQPEFTREVIEGAAQLATRQLAPLNSVGDQEGCRLTEGRVQTPQGFPEAHLHTREGGWIALGLPEALGGAGLPPVLDIAVTEYLCAANPALQMYSGFGATAARMLSVLGDEWIKQQIVPKLVSGEWTATMALTESHCGSDLRQIRTRAFPQSDGTYRISGGKIFISGGDQDLTDNIIHILLAKIPDASGRISNLLADVGVFVVPKKLVDTESGEIGAFNEVSVVSIERKMGLHGNATCVLSFDEAVGYRVAPAGDGSARGMAGMFLMMNYARLAVAASSVGASEACYQVAAAYAKERRAGRAPDGAREPAMPADALLAHPDVRRMLMLSRSFTEGARATVMRASLWQTLAESSSDENERGTSRDLLDFLTPVLKAYCSDKASEAANACLQVLGGHGYVQDYGLEQRVRDQRIGAIYEGANGIQAMDFVERKLLAKDGRLATAWIEAVEESLARHEAGIKQKDLVTALRASLNEVRSAFNVVAKSGPVDRAACAYDLLTMVGIVTVGWQWLEIVAAATAAVEMHGRPPALLEVKSALARYWAERELPMTAGLLARIRQGTGALQALDDSLF